jgi:hypothetical protein
VDMAREIFTQGVTRDRVVIYYAYQAGLEARFAMARCKAYPMWLEQRSVATEEGGM